MLPGFSFVLLNAGSLVDLTRSLDISGMLEKVGHLVVIRCMFGEISQIKVL